MAAPKKKRYCGPRLTYARAAFAHLRLLGRRPLQLGKSTLRVPVEIRASAPRWMVMGRTRPVLLSPLQVGFGTPVMPRVGVACVGVVGPQLWVCRDAQLPHAAVAGIGPTPIVGSP